MPPGTGAATIERFVHRGDDGGVLTHPEVVVRAPHRDFAAAAVAVKGGEREPARPPLEIGKNAVVAVASEAIKLLTKKRLVVHRNLHCARRPACSDLRLQEEAAAVNAAAAFRAGYPLLSFIVATVTCGQRMSLKIRITSWEYCSCRNVECSQNGSSSKIGLAGRPGPVCSGIGG